ncbi:MAG: hypothetical protein LBI28_05230 [Treponema sp.]|jgi:hypothetical protein|nr:hypothetical protein [Treponema sp.]
MKKLFFAVAVIIAAIALGCTSTGGREPPPPPPEGAERLVLENGAYAIFRFDLPPGTTWSNYNKITADYMVDERNLRRPQRNSNNVRLMGNYRAEQFTASSGIRNFNMEDGAGSSNGPYIMDNTPRTFATMGAVADEWFTVEYDITGSKGHQQFVRANVPAPTATGPFYFGIGIPSQAEGSSSGIVQYVKNVTLHHANNPSLNVVSTGSGFEEPTFVSFFPVLSSRSGPPAE